MMMKLAIANKNADENSNFKTDFTDEDHKLKNLTKTTMFLTLVTTFLFYLPGVLVGAIQ